MFGLVPNHSCLTTLSANCGDVAYDRTFDPLDRMPILAAHSATCGRRRAKLTAVILWVIF